MAFNPMNKVERDILVRNIINIISRPHTEFEKLLVLCWIYELILSYIIESVNLSVASYDLAKNHFGEEKMFMQVLKACRDNFVHKGITPTMNHLVAIKNYAIEIITTIQNICGIVNNSDKILIETFILNL